MSRVDPSGRKQNLRDWMTATAQLQKVQDPKQTVADVVDYFRSTYKIKMNEAWIKGALYGVSAHR